MLSSCYPFAADTQIELYLAIKTGSFNIVDGPWRTVSDSAKALICSLLVVDPADRLTIGEVLRHPWFSGISAVLDTKRATEKIMLNLCNYTAPHRLKAEVTKILIKHVLYSDWPEHKHVFNIIDTDLTGYLTFTKLGRAYKALGIELQGSEIMKIIDSVDQSRNGRISFSAFLSTSLDLDSIITDKVLQEAFAYFDTFSKGYITATDFQKTLKRSGVTLSNSEIAVMMSQFSRDIDCLFSVKEFARMMSSKKSGAMSQMSTMDLSPSDSN